LREIAESAMAGSTPLSDVLTEPVVAHTDEPLRVVVTRMAETGLTRMPVIERGSRRLAGMIALGDLLTARVRNLNEERQRERVLRIRLPFGRRYAERES
jgi:CBS domain-containing protein